MESLPRIGRGELAVLDDLSLIREAVKPIIAAIRGRSPALKAGIHEALSPGRRGLLAFWVLFGHAGYDGWTRFFGEVSDLSEFPELLPALRRAFYAIGDEGMTALVADVQALQAARDRAGDDGLPEPGGPAMVEALRALDARYETLVHGSLTRMAAMVRERATEFFIVT